MFNLIISSPDTSKRSEYIQKYLTQLSISKFDITTISRDTAIKQNVKSIGISEIKNMQKKLYLKPVQSPIKAVIIEEAHLLTTEAQNSMLKILEEPPENTLIILSSDSKENLLPTIQSRCQMINLQTENPILSDKEKTDLAQFIDDLPSLPISSLLKKAETLSKDKQKATTWLENLILIHRQNLLEAYQHNNLTIKQFNNLFINLKTLQKSYTLLRTTNVNARFLLETTLLSL